MFLDVPSIPSIQSVLKYHAGGVNQEVQSSGDNWLDLTKEAKAAVYLHQGASCKSPAPASPGSPPGWKSQTDLAPKLWFPNSKGLPGRKQLSFFAESRCQGTPVRGFERSYRVIEDSCWQDSLMPFHHKISRMLAPKRHPRSAQLRPKHNVLAIRRQRNLPGSHTAPTW